jgi:Leucine-rich repeat (LRR) protein
LDVCQNHLKSLPHLGNLRNLVDLNLQCNQLTSLPVDLENLISLKRLHIGYNRLPEFPKCLAGMRSLEELDLEGNNMERIGPEIGNLMRVQKLYLSRNRLVELPEELSQLTECRELFLKGLCSVRAFFRGWFAYVGVLSCPAPVRAC